MTDSKGSTVIELGLNSTMIKAANATAIDADCFTPDFRKYALFSQLVTYSHFHSIRWA